MVFVQGLNMPEIREISGHEVRKSLTVLLREAHDDPVVAAQRAESFEVLAGKKKFDLNRQLVVSQDDEIIFSSFLMPHDGGSAFLFISDPRNISLQWQAMAETALRQLIESASADYKFLQLMLEPEDTGRIALARRVGFKLGSEMHYMYRQISSKVGAVRIPPRVNWQVYSERNHELFAETIEKTWKESRDCNFICNLRTVEDCMAGYKASASYFDRSHWSLMLIDKTPAGVCLLSPLMAKDNVELTYTGVVPEFRGRGLGKVMLNRAMALCAIDGFRVMTLAVDSRNHYARSLYNEVGFKDMFIKAAYFYAINNFNANKLHSQTIITNPT